MKSLAQFFDRLKLMPMRWDIQRNDELSGTGEGVVYQAELAPPLWRADITIRPVRLTEAQAISALVRGLDGALEPFLFRDPYICGPRLDPAGTIFRGELAEYAATDAKTGKTIYAAAVMDFSAGFYLSPEDPTVTVQSAGGRSLALTGLPGGYALSVGDKIQIVTAGGRHAFVEVSEDVTANGGGVTAAFQVFPSLPASVSFGDAVTLIRPACPCIVVPKSFQTGSVNGNIVSGMGFSIVQKRGV